MGFLAVLAVAGVALSTIYAISSYNQNQDEIEYSRQQDSLKAAEQNISSLESYIGSIESGYISLDGYLDKIDSLQSLITSDQEYVGIYESILEGDRTGSEEARDIATLENNISIAASKIEAYKRQKQLAETNAKNYLAQSAIEKTEAVNTGLSEYSDMMKQRSMSNVMASSTGAIRGAYSSAALRQQNKLMDYIGVDAKFNTDGEGGSFLSKYILLQNQINAQINANNEDIQLLEVSKQQSEMEKTKAQGDLDTQMENLESKYNKVTGDTGSLKSNQKALEQQRQNLELAKSNIKLYKANAINALKSYRENAKAGGKSNQEIKKELEALNNKYDGAEVNEELKSMLDEIFA